MGTTKADPVDAAARLLAENDEEWVAQLADELDRRLGARGLSHVMRTWQLSVTDLGELFGVSRQAVSRWLEDGVPPDRAPQVADVEAIAEILERHLRPQRIPAVVRRSATGLGDQSLLSLISSGRSNDAVALARQMFTFGDLHR